MSDKPVDPARDRERESAKAKASGRGKSADTPEAGSQEAPKKAFALRLSATVFDGIQRWADDELRSLNAQIEYLLRDALRKAGRWRD